jgi:hypothetical protein
MKSVRTIFILSGIGVIISLGVAAYFMFMGPDSLDFSGKSLPEMLQDGTLLGLLVIPVVLIIIGVSMRPFLRIIFPGEIKNGVTAQAKVLKVWDTGVSINDNPQVGLLLEVSPPGGNSFQAEAKTVVSRLNAALVQPGVTAEVKYDPEKPQRLQLLTLNIQSATSSNATARMEELNELYDKGLITKEEYQQKREEILKAL